jgi:polar amino acid transport system substrate-binding protein
MMKYRKICILLAAILLIGIVTNSCSRFFKKARYIVATSPSTPPLVMLDADKDIIGFDIDVINQIALRMDMNVKIIPVLKTNLLYGLIDETYDIAIASITLPAEASEAESPEIDYSDPYLEIGEVIVLSEDFGEYSGFDDLADKIVGIEKGSESKRVLGRQKGITVREYAEIEYAYEDIALGKIDAISVDLPHAVQTVYLSDEYNRILKIQPEPVTKKQYVIAVKSGSNILLNQINSGLEKIKKDGSLEMLVEKWFFAQ